mgnify:CR=1 FL=1
MFGVIGGLILLVAVAVYSAVLIGKKTDERVLKLLNEDSVDTPIQVRFPEDVLRPRERADRAKVRVGKQSV